MRVTVLVENSRLESRPDLEAQHGLSLYLETGEHRILFDAGSSDAFARNADRLGVRLEDVDLAVLSHHHYDHGGGLRHFLAANGRAPVYLQRNAAGPGSFSAFGLGRRPIGIDTRVFDEHPGRFVFLDADTDIVPGVTILTEILRRHPLPRGNRFLFAGAGSDRRPDPFDHELILVVRQGEDLATFTGCSHRGVLNMLDTVDQRFPGASTRAVFGGFHLVGLPRLKLDLLGTPKRQVRALGAELLRRPIAKAYTGHCTGARAYRMLSQIMGDRLAPMPTGLVVEV